MLRSYVPPQRAGNYVVQIPIIYQWLHIILLSPASDLHPLIVTPSPCFPFDFP